VWFSPSARNIYLSVLLRPSIEATRAAGLTLAAGIGVCEALKATTGLDIWLKWPNDIFVGRRKLGGILTEAVTSGSRVDAVVVGVGLNINIATSEVPADLQPMITSAQIETGRPFDRMAIVHPLRNSIVHWCDTYVAEGWPGLRSGIARWDQSKGLPVQICDGTDREGISEGIDEVGQLRVSLASGEILHLNTGEVRVRP
jgi:BirA family biotin operon repressor/biotin-[acetyl-CoA-carboxylase] ligase